VGPTYQCELVLNIERLSDYHENKKRTICVKKTVVGKFNSSLPAVRQAKSVRPVSNDDILGLNCEMFSVLISGLEMDA
jgi:hypothetical protein